MRAVSPISACVRLLFFVGALPANSSGCLARYLSSSDLVGAGMMPSTAPSDTKRRTFTIVGVLLKFDESPAAGVTVELRKGMPAGHGKEPTVAKATTGADGAFRIEGIEVHYRYVLVAGSGKRGWFYENVTMDPGRDIDLGVQRLVGNGHDDAAKSSATIVP